MQPLMERNGSLSHLLRTLRESCHIAQGLVFNGSDVFWAGMSGLYPAWASTYDSELESFNHQMGIGLSSYLTPVRLVLFHHALALAITPSTPFKLAHSILCLQSDLSLWHPAFQSFLTSFHWPFISCFFSPNPHSGPPHPLS